MTLVEGTAREKNFQNFQFSSDRLTWKNFSFALNDLSAEFPKFTLLGGGNVIDFIKTL